MRFVRNALVVAVLLGYTVPVAGNDFVGAVAPALTQRCLSCHNDDRAEGGLSLTDPAALINQGYVQPGDPNASHLIDLISPVNGVAEMPKDSDPLAADEFAAIEAWIAAGATVPERHRLRPTVVSDRNWWSLDPIAAVTGTITAATIDRSIDARLDEAGLSPLPVAAPITLIRRVTYDLTGLPPTPQEVDSFVEQYQRQPESAWRGLVDRLLDVPEFGEKFAQHWLDVARYAETHGYDKDKPRENAWPYRDYVIASFNDDKPVGEFVREQIAGDVLANDPSEGIVATGFLAAGPWDFIGHVEVGEKKLDGRIAKHLDRDEMIAAVFNVFQSTTIQCAQCHHHKFDPIRSEDYYRLHAVFAAVDRADRVYTGRTSEQSDRAAALTESVQELRKQRSDLSSRRDAKLRESLSEIDDQLQSLQLPNSIPAPEQHGYHSLIADRAETSKWLEIDLGSAQFVDRIELVACYDNYNNIGEGFGFPRRFHVDVTAADSFTDAAPRRVLNATDQRFDNPGAAPVPIGLDGKPVRLIRITATELAERKDDYILALGEVRALVGRKNVAIGATVRCSDAIASNARWSPPFVVDDRYYGRSIDAQKLIRRAQLQSKKHRLVETSPLTGSLKTVDEKLAETQTALSKIPAGQSVYAIATQFPGRGKFEATGGTPRPVHVLHRGDLRSPGQRVLPGAPPLWKNAPAVFEPITSDTQWNARAALADYVTRRDNPLLWRSMANRIWQWVMGRPIVSTPNDFGRMGGQPTHPKLLDALAASLRDDPRQSIKTVVRALVMTRAYRRASFDPVQDAMMQSNAAVDAGNQLMWRFNRRRLTAEEFRDTLLAVAGVLDLNRRGGPSFKDFVIESPQHSPHYQYHLHDPNDSATHRRTIYRFVVRSQPQPMLTTLDCADPSISTAQRDESTTSLQALTQWNSRFVAAMCQQMAKRVERHAGLLGTPTEEARTELACRLAWGRPPTDSERSILCQLVRSQGVPTLCRVVTNASSMLYLD